MAELIQADLRKPCCREETNLELVSITPRTLLHLSSSARVPATETCRRCRVCGCRHFEVVAEPGRIQLRSA